MKAKLLRGSLGCFLISLLIMGSAAGQSSPHLGINVGIASWLSNCDIPSGGHNSGLEPAFGPLFSLSYGKLRLGGTFFIGNYDIEPEDGVIRVSETEVRFADEEAHKRGFTSIGETQRMDLSLYLRYEFNRYIQISLGMVLNRHEADIITYWSPLINDKGILELPSDASRKRPLRYTDNQFWLSEGIHGSLPVETVSNRFSLFYNLNVLFIAGESGDGFVGDKDGNPVKDENMEVIAYGPRVSYTNNDDGSIVFPPRPIPNRSFGSNVGITFSTGLGFQISNVPPLNVFAGYNFKFFSEEKTEVIDHSRFHGPYLGLIYNLR